MDSYVAGSYRKDRKGGRESLFGGSTGQVVRVKSELGGEARDEFMEWAVGRDGDFRRCGCGGTRCVAAAGVPVWR